MGGTCSHLQHSWLHSYWLAPIIATSGLVQHWKSTIHGLSVKSDKSDWLRKGNKYSGHAQKIGSGQSSQFLAHWSQREYSVVSGAPAAWRAAKWSPIIIEKGTTCMHRNRNPCKSFLMVKMASGMDHGRVCPTTMTTTTTSHNMVAIQLILSHAVLDYSIFLWY